MYVMFVFCSSRIQSLTVSTSVCKGPEMTCSNDLFYFFAPLPCLPHPTCCAVVLLVNSIKSEHLEMIKAVLPGGTENARSQQSLNGRKLSVAGTIQL